MNYAFGDDDPGAWIDFNLDALFDTTEAIMLADYDSTHTARGTFIVPAHAVENDTLRLRVRNSFFSVPVPCGNDAGEVEDYPVYIKGAVGLEEGVQSQQISLFPNPATSILTLVSNQEIFQNEIQLLNLLGQDLTSALGVRMNSGYQTNLDLRRLPKGMYILRYKTQNYKFVKE